MVASKIKEIRATVRIFMAITLSKFRGKISWAQQPANPAVGALPCPFPGALHNCANNCHYFP
jgi:hypothetical protein